MNPTIKELEDLQKASEEDCRRFGNRVITLSEANEARENPLTPGGTGFRFVSSGYDHT